MTVTPVYFAGRQIGEFHANGASSRYLSNRDIPEGWSRHGDCLIRFMTQEEHEEYERDPIGWMEANS